MFAGIRNFYKEHLHHYRVQIGVPAFCAFLLFSLPVLQTKYDLNIFAVLVIGGLLLLYTFYHGYLIQTLSNDELALYKHELSAHKEDLSALSVANSIYRHLINLTNKLVNEKRSFLRAAHLKDPLEKFGFCVELNLAMLYEFYKLHSGPEVNFRIVFFLPSGDEEYLIPVVWYNELNMPPDSYDKPAVYEQRFSNESDLKVCYSWRNKNMCIVEDAGKERLTTSHGRQAEYLKSLLTYPIIYTDGAVLGVISFVANKPGFFKKDASEMHRFIFNHFATRIMFEYDILQNEMSEEGSHDQNKD